MDPEDADTKQCEYCGEAIKKAAIKCRHCGEGLDGHQMDRARPQQAVDSAAMLSLVLGLLSLVGVFFCLLLAVVGPVAIWKGTQSRQLARKANIPAPGTALAGIVLGWISSALLVLAIVVVVVMVAINALK